VEPGLRSAFNAAYGPHVHDYVTREMARRHGLDGFSFRLAETPVLLSHRIRDACEAAAREIVEEMSRAAVISHGGERIPDRYRVPATDVLPHMAVVDFALCSGPGGEIVPRLIEAQGFPSLYAMQVIQGDVWAEALAGMPGLPREWSWFFSGLSRDEYLALLRRTVVGDADPDQVVLLDIVPEKQKTRADFIATEKFLGVRAACVTALVREGRKLFVPREGKLVPVKRIYNRVVFDELEAMGIVPPFDWRERLDVTWVPHPNWYWIWSKATIPRLSHSAVPRAEFLSDVDLASIDLSRRVLKPLFSFAGRGVVIDVTRETIDAIPEKSRRDWLLMEKVEYAPKLLTPSGVGVKVEIRVLLLRPDGEDALVPAINLCRLSRAKMHGVDHNKDLDWVGSSIGVVSR